jgi:membrane protein implicated in regulation of membrane protease activity
MPKGRVSLIIAVAFVAVVMILAPAARWFVAISAGVGMAVAGILYWWRTRRPITEKDIDDQKRPLGL